MLSLATGRAAWPDEKLPAGTRWNDQAGDLDGVVSLVIDGDVPEPAVAGTLETAARQVAAVLRAELPYCHIQAVAGSSDSYATAFGQLEQARSDGAFLV